MTIGLDKGGFLDEKRDNHRPGKENILGERYDGPKPRKERFLREAG